MSSDSESINSDDSPINSPSPAHSVQSPQNKKVISSIIINQPEKNLASIEFNEESHTLGNALRYCISLDPRTDFVGYSVPRPSENAMVMRIQTVENQNVKPVVKQGLLGLQKLCLKLKEMLDHQEANFKK